MASHILYPLFIIFPIFFLACAGQVTICRRIKSIYQFGDSISDNGNAIRLFSEAAGNYPYGETFPGYPTGRWCDGRIIPDYIGRLRRALIIIGEIGVNDISYSLLGGKSIEEIKTYLPSTMESIENAVIEVIKLGATQILVPGNIPLGCLSSVLTLFGTDNSCGSSSDYDELGCLKDYNELVEEQNQQLQSTINSLQNKFPHILVEYVDYYNAFRTVIQHHIVNKPMCPGQMCPLAACCGIGGRYNYNQSMQCGTPGVPVCENPNDYVMWEGGHFTQETYRQVSQIIIPEIQSKIQCGYYYTK